MQFIKVKLSPSCGSAQWFTGLDPSSSKISYQISLKLIWSNLIDLCRSTCDIIDPVKKNQNNINFI